MLPELFVDFRVVGRLDIIVLRSIQPIVGNVQRYRVVPRFLDAVFVVLEGLLTVLGG